MKKFLSVVACAVVLGFAGTSMAIPVGENWAADFRSSDWSGANGRDSFTVDGIKAEAFPNAGWPNYKLYQDSLDGLGVNWSGLILSDDNGDEIDDNEALKITSGAGFLSNGIWITDLFGPPDGNHSTNGEMGTVSLNNGAYSFSFYGKDADQNNGEYWLDFGGTLLVKSAKFEVTGPGGTICNWDDNEFSVAGFTKPVPEPTTMLLFGTGLIGLAGMSRRKKK